MNERQKFKFNYKKANQNMIYKLLKVMNQMLNNQTTDKT